MSDAAPLPRELEFTSYEEISAEIGRLRVGAYRSLGQWSLGQTCGHLAYYLRGSLVGFDFTVPWVVRFFFGRPFLRRVLKTGKMKRDGPTVPASLISTDRSETQEDALVDDCQLWLARLGEHDGPLEPSPFLGDVTPEQWKRVHCVHAAHHLGLLIPVESNLGETVVS